MLNVFIYTTCQAAIYRNKLFTKWLLVKICIAAASNLVLKNFIIARLQYEHSFKQISRLMARHEEIEYIKKISEYYAQIQKFLPDGVQLCHLFLLFLMRGHIMIQH